MHQLFGNSPGTDEAAASGRLDFGHVLRPMAPGDAGGACVGYQFGKDAARRVLAVDAAVEHLTGHAATDFTQGRLGWAEMIHADDRGHVLTCQRDAARHGRAFQVGYRIRHRDGGDRYVWEQGRGLFDDDGRLLGYAGFIGDVTARELERQQSVERAKRARAVLETLPAAVYSCDADGRITGYNAHAVRLWGREPRLGELEARICGSLRLWLPDGQPLEHEASPMARAVFEGVGCRNGEVVIERPDGSRVQVLANIEPLRDEQGRLVGAVNAFIDVTALRQAERAVRASEARLRRLADAMPQLVWTARPDGTVDYYNRRVTEFAGIQHAADDNWSWQPVLHPEDREPTKAAWQEAVAGGGGTYECEHRVRMADGHLRWHLSRAVPLRDEDGRVVKWFGTATDIHDVKMAQEALREADERKSQFVATLAHELRNPLAPIRNAVELLALIQPLPAAASSARDIIDRQSRHLARLVDDLLDMGRITRGRLQLQRQRVALAAVVEHAVETLRPAIEHKGQVLDVRLPEAPVSLHADPARLAQVLVNLLDNASKYSPEGGHIALSVDVGSADIVVQIRDNGIGISAGDLPRLFETFARVGPASGQQRTGLGIGLALTRRLVEMHGGTIEAESDGPGRGSTMTVRLPLGVVNEEADGTPGPETATEEAAAPADPSGQPAAPPRVLVADDNVDVVQSLAMLLELSGYEVDTAGDGPSAVTAAARGRPDIVLLDIGMPGIDGNEACRRIRQGPDGKAMRIFALTGWGQDDDRRRSTEAGFDGHLVKPVEPTALLELLRDAC